jgi:hypothetical protein
MQNTEELGNEISVYNVELKRLFLGTFSWIVTILIILLLGHFILGPIEHIGLITACTAVILIVAGIIYFFQHPKIRAYERGFMYIDGKRSFTCLWEDVQAIDFSRFPYSQVYGNNTSMSFRIITKKGTTRKLNMMKDPADTDILSFFEKKSGIRPGYKQLR